MNDFSIAALKTAGFTGFRSIAYLRDKGFADIPEKKGVYVVCRNSFRPTRFLRRSPAGHFKGRDPSVPITVLRERWIDVAPVLYIGKAGGKGSSATLRSRLRAYLDFGAGKKVGHWGSRLIWQLADVGSCTICWWPVNVEPRSYEKQLLGAFVEYYGKRPFANLSEW